MNLDDYELVKMLDTGGFAHVHLMKHRQTGEKIAVKTLKKQERKDKDSVHRFNREIKILTILKGHENVIEIIHSEFSDLKALIVMPVADENLFDYIQRENAGLKLEDRVSLFDHILDGMLAAHKNNILHRDLAPQNVLVFTTEKGIVLKLADFGLGKRLDSNSMNANSHVKNMGRELYTAPEVLDSLEDATHASDVYSMGKLLQFVATGRAPKFNPKGEFAFLIRKATAENPEERYQSAEEFHAGYFEIKAFTFGPADAMTLREMAAATGGGIDWQAFHHVVMGKRYSDPLDECLLPVTEIFSKPANLESYLDFVGGDLIEFIKAYRIAIDKFYALRKWWPYAGVTTFCELLARIYAAADDDEVKLQCLSQIWQHAYPEDQYGEQDRIDKLIPVVPKGIQIEFSKVMVASKGSITNTKRLQALRASPVIRKAIEELLKAGPA